MASKCAQCGAEWTLPKGTTAATESPPCPLCLRGETERHPDILEFPYDVERVLTLNVALKDIAMPAHLPAADPYGFVSCIGIVSIEPEVALVATSRIYSPKLLELEAVLEPLLPVEGETPKAEGSLSAGVTEESSISSVKGPVSEADDNTSASVKSKRDQTSQSTIDTKLSPQTEMKNLVVAYFCLSDLASRLNLPNLSGVIKHALALYRHCSSQSNMRNRHVESMAVAALVMASRQFNSPRTIQEVAKEASVKMKEIGRYLRLMNESYKDNPQRPPENSSLVVEYVQRFCNTLTLSQRVQEVATHIATQLITQTLTTRQNPVSISAAAIYITCLLEDDKRTQSDICKAAALTEVTLRKCYREVAAHLTALLPAGYVPAVPIDRALNQAKPLPAPDRGVYVYHGYASATVLPLPPKPSG